jgi:serine/threonine protein kinase
MAKHIAFGKPENESERMAFEYLRDHLPDTYTLYTNLEIRQGQEIYEIDMILLGPNGVFVTDVKDWRGRIELFTTSWDCNSQSRHSPLRKLRNHAKVLSTLICDTNRALYQQLRQVHVQASVLLTPDDVRIVDRANFDGQHVVKLDKRGLSYFQGDQHIPYHRLKNIQRYITYVDRAIQKNAHSRSAPRRYQKWRVIEPPYEKNDCKGYTAYRVKDTTLGSLSPVYQLKVYEFDPLLSEDERTQQIQLISNAFQALKQIRSQDYILSIEDFSPYEGNQFLLVTEEAAGQPLDHYIQRQDLSLEQKLDIMGEVLRALEHIHARGVVHRNLTPETVWITPEGRVRLTGFDFARITSRTATVAELIAEDLAEDVLYQAPECQGRPKEASVTSDLFSAGLIFYELLTGSPAFTDAEQMYQSEVVLAPSQIVSELSVDFDRWLQRLCDCDSKQRFETATIAIAAFPPPPAPTSTLDVSSLQPGTILNDLYEVVCQLGSRGRFAIAYKVLEIRSSKPCVMKVVDRGRSVYERVLQEYRTLRNTEKHPHIVDVLHSGDLSNGIPFIIFEYVEGSDVQELMQAGELSLEQAIEITKQTAAGLQHLHNQNPSVFHQDIKPSNLVMTRNGVRIIDFNIAVMAGEEVTLPAGTRSYLPPGSQLKSPINDAEKLDRDLYALGIVLYECVTGCYPFDASQLPTGQNPIDPKQLPRCKDLSPELVQLMLKAIAPTRSDRFASAAEFLKALESLPFLRQSDLQKQSVDNELTQVAQIASLATPIARESITPQLVQEHVVSTSAISKGKFDLFDVQWLKDNSKPNPDKPIVIDPTGCYEPTSEQYILIETEAEWLRFFGQNDTFYWIRGQGKRDKLCEWTQQWLRVHSKEYLIDHIKQVPQEKLAILFGSVSIPWNWSDEELLILANQLDRYPQDDPIARLLADITDSDIQIWMGQPSINHLAAWLEIVVPEKCKILEQVWATRFVEHELCSYYATPDKLNLLKRWIGIAEPRVPELEPYPLAIPNFLVSQFDQYWEQQFYRSEAGILDTLVLEEVPGRERVVAQAYKVLQQRPSWCTQVREDKLAPYLTVQQSRKLRDWKLPVQPNPLPLQATAQETLTWVTQEYLKFRRREVEMQPTSHEGRISDRLAESFVDWLLQYYPDLVSIPVAESFLNYNVTSEVQSLCEKHPVLWVVVDGLGWLDHLELLSFLDAQGITSTTDIQPRFSILPTLTGYAKWSLYSQRLPSHASWSSDAGKGFPKTDLGRRYTDDQKTFLLRDLRKGKNRLYCWDTTEFDKLFHKSGDWQHLYYTTRLNALRSLAAEICSLVSEFPDPDQLHVVIASDHGQMLGELPQISPHPVGLEPQGRAAIGRTDDSRFVILEPSRYSLPHPISVVRGTDSLGSFISYTNQPVIGSHGGLFPEEVVVGMSVLRKAATRSLLIVKCQGEGRPREEGELMVTIDNPNSLTVSDLLLKVNEIPALRSGISIQQIIPANKPVSIKIPITYPELPPGSDTSRLSLSGQLTYRFNNAEATTVQLSADSALTVNQMFSSGLDIDEFL